MAKWAENGRFLFETKQEYNNYARYDISRAMDSISYLCSILDPSECEEEANQIIWEYYVDGVDTFTLSRIIIAVERHMSILIGQTYKIQLIGDWVFNWKSLTYCDFTREAIMRIWE